jgi:quinoprotein relay system zinc metallohydrolase 2
MTPRPSRRAVLASGLCLCCLPAAGRAEWTGVVEVASGVFVRRGPDEEATAANQGGIANIGFVVGNRAVLVADPGGSLADGQRLRAEIRGRTELPIRHVVVSHVHPDHSFGAAAFVEDQPNVVGHWRLRAALAARGDFYRRRLAEVLGADAGWPVPPTQEVGEAGAELDLGGRTIRLTAHRVAHTDCDLSMLDTATGLLLPADLLFVGRVPALDGSLAGWLEECRRLRATRAARAVPGHGPVAVELAPALADLERYLGVLRDETRQAIERGEPIDRAAATAAQSERGRWALFDDYNGRNVIQAYKELEWE